MSKLIIKHTSQDQPLYLDLIRIRTKMPSTLLLYILLSPPLSHLTLTCFADFLSTLGTDVGDFQDSVLGLHFSFFHIPSVVTFIHSIELNYHAYDPHFQILISGSEFFQLHYCVSQCLPDSLLRSLQVSHLNRFKTKCFDKLFLLNTFP